jgi:DNA polymerase III delta prime subunit
VVRNTIKQFAQAKVTLPPGRHKVVILDEADRCRSHDIACMPGHWAWGQKQESASL